MGYKRLIKRHFKVNQIGWKISRKGLFYIALNFPTKEGQRKAFAIYLLSISTPIDYITKDMGITTRTLHSWLESFNERGPVFFTDTSLDLQVDRIDERSGLSTEDISSGDALSEETLLTQSSIIKKSNERLKSLQGDVKEVISKPILDDADIESIIEDGVNDYLKTHGKLKSGPPPKIKHNILADVTLPEKPKDVNNMALKILQQAMKEGKRT